ncbi:2-isopropylmalate synthase [Paenibacillus turpanensis]|uniref:2-isopropylmalate synthase n=1 Tax=Paenibacillus turpanensis TaxID=2689078 RepID=UPI0014094828|nr:2-isopropylmalate synthase [Paenibacillus turpanensis]
MSMIHIFDTTLRDGEQSPGASITPEDKVRIALQLEKLGVDIIEPGFPASSPGDFRAVQEISRRVRAAEICGFARAVRSDIDAAVKATEEAARRRLHLFISSSQIHMDFQLRKTREEVLRIAREMVAYGKQFVHEIEFSPMDASRSGEDFLYEMVEAVIAEGATVINLPDTVGYALPEEYGAMFTRVRSNVRGGDSVRWSAHCHNDLGLAVANSLAAIQAGATQVEVTVNGIGERAGNCSLEELVMAVETRKNTLLAETAIEKSEIYRTSQMVSRTMHLPVAYNKPVVGRNAFQHEAGIHQDGLLKNRSTYEIMDPEQLGVPRDMIVLGKHSGRHAIKHRVSQFGVELTEEQLDDVFKRFKQFADDRKIVTDDELAVLVGKAVDQAIVPFEFVDMQMMTAAASGSRVAAVTLRNTADGAVQTFTAAGQGPIEAAIIAMKQAMPVPVEFEHLELHSMASGEAAYCEAAVHVRARGCGYRGSAIDDDVIVAAAKAYLAAANEAVRSGASRAAAVSASSAVSEPKRDA